ncbi:hypothetical protein chiPu_0020836, partial [Chiloscyllium punctatum]|nr:hypothetical protein [Chiloscyllium punctatum]
QSPKVVIIEPSDGVIKEGEWFTLKCLYKSKFVKANWYKNSYYEDKVSGIAVSETGGFYQCQRDDWWRYHTRSERLEVVTIASDETLTVQFRSRTLLLGETSVLKCSRYPWASERDPTFFWYRNNSLIEGKHEPEYTIAKARFSDGANYRCERKVGFRKWISRDVSIIVRVPVAGVTLTNRANKTEILIGSRLVLECELSRGTGPSFQWYFQQEAFNNASGNYNFSSDRSELAIESFQSQHQGRYQCGAINRAPGGAIFNVTSNFIDLTVPAQAHSAEMAVLIVPLFLILSLLILLPIKLRNRKQGG